MSLRTRLFLTSLLVAVPLAAALFMIDTNMRLVSREQGLRRSVELDVSAGLRERCEADPPRFGRPGRGGGEPPPEGPGRGPGPRPDQGPDRGGGPRPDRATDRGPGQGPGPGAGRDRGGGPRGPGRAAGDPYQYFAYDASGRPTAADAPPLPDRRDGASASNYWSGTGLGVALVVPLGGEGPCAFILARIPPRRGELRDQVVGLTLVVFSVLAAAWVAAGPVISKLRRLADGVLYSAASHYAEPVKLEGSDEVTSLARAFNEAGQRVRGHLMDVQSREEALRGFVADTTHDVAIPLTVLQGHLADLDRELDAPAHREHVRAAIREAHYMASLLRNLAAATRLDERTAALALAPVDLSALVERVVARHRPIARASGVELNVAVPDPPLVAQSDHTLLEQALSNLVDNAIRYNHDGGHVAVLLDREGAGFVMSVTDDGPGVADEELALLTTRWFRGSEARTRRPDGKGLGLAIVAEAIRRLGLSLTFVRPGGAGLRAEIRQADGGQQ
jgi:two-component system sensor histidine kinase BaeS